jgi:hypothetical protein
MRRLALLTVAIVVLLLPLVGVAHASQCSHPLCDPCQADIVKSGTTIQVTLTLRDSGSHVSNWFDPPGASCKSGVCVVNVEVTCTSGPSCYVLYYLHDESHTYSGMPPDVHLVNLYVNGKLFLSIDPPVAAGPVGGSIYSVNTVALFSPWLTVIGLTGCIGTVVVVVKRRRS